MTDSIVSPLRSQAAPSARPGRGPGGLRRWLVLTHHLPPEPAYFRVKVRRRLDRIGAVALKNSVYVLPATDEALEDFQWLFQEIRSGGGEATIAETTFVDDVTESRLVDEFRALREADYERLAADAVATLATVEATGDAPPAEPAEAAVADLARKLEAVVAVDYFEAEGRAAAEHAVRRAREAVLGRRAPAGAPGPVDVGRGRTWVTRAGVKVDRIASAWLIRRLIDPEARFVFVDPRAWTHEGEELRFDMFEGEFTHEADACTFEVLLARFAIRDPALDALAQIVHDIDCKDDKFGRAECPGVASLIDGVVRSRDDDDERLERGAAIFDELYEHFRWSAV